jgi:tetratricopeptide (TPR) repeat protein
MRRLAVSAALSVAPVLAHAAVDVLALWDFSRPEVSEARFQEAAKNASADDAAILQTQIARTWGLRRKFEQARTVLAPLAPRLPQLSPQAQARYHLEWGRTLVSAAHPRAQLTDDDRAAARRSYLEAHRIAQAHQLDYLAVDALHMLPFVETDAEAAQRWNLQALAAVEASTQPDAKRWEASLRNNIGFTLHEMKRYDEALAMFRSALPVLERAGNPGRLRIGHWMVAWTLRAMGRADEALAIQLRLEQENRAAGTPDEHVFDELRQLYAAKGDTAKAERYAALHEQAKKK